MSRLSEAVEHLRDRLRDTTTGAGLVATVNDAEGTEIVAGIDIVEIDLRRAVRFDAELLLEVDDTAFLVGVDVLAADPAIGWEIVIGSRLYRVTEREELQTCWTWHDRERVQRVIFAKDWGE